MPIKLGLPKEPYWLDLGHGVRVQVKPFSTAVEYAAESEAQSMLMDEAKRREILPWDMDVSDIIRGSEVEYDLVGLSRAITVTTLARRGIVDWEGVDAECTPENISGLMEMVPFGGNFYRAYIRPHMEVAEEGNASGAAPNGGSAAAPSPATTAENSESLAQ